MKKTLYLLTATLLITTATTFQGCSKSDDDPEVTPVSTLTETEKNDLLHLREEEKLARDVYLYSFDKYGLNISKNISNSEQSHMDAVLEIIEKYNLEDNSSEVTGVFNNEELQTLYNNLTAQVDISVDEALQVGATIEDLDIYDIEEFISRTENDDILAMYDMLMCGSRNHLRSYYSQIVSNGEDYSVKFINQIEFENIISSDKEQCGL